MTSEVLNDLSVITEIEPQELAPTKVIDLDDWFVPVAEAEATTQRQPSTADQALEIEKTEATFTLPAFYFVRASQPAREVEEIQLALDFG
ncbi:MAG: hypothetical protein ACREBG_18520 [Pyrinomonadaceae bacterium]